MTDERAKWEEAQDSKLKTKAYDALVDASKRIERGDYLSAAVHIGEAGGFLEAMSYYDKDLWSKRRTLHSTLVTRFYREWSPNV